ncbi:hypothetical protein ACFOWM_03245 [Ferruginibacter yonginensis]|uniref:Outer membrane protein transport protein (OMPP1/FadL/TodX) n=1 Tax=Ferruginibacter yonginensis TaxID=1310416 RepID=A0ABV8QQ42_9BACT
MMRFIFILIGCTIQYNICAQIPEDAIRYSWFPQNGTARTLAIGGTMASLGGDVSANFVNPAGIGFYKTNELVISPAFSLNNIKTDYRSNKTTEKNNHFNLGTSGAVFAFTNSYNTEKSGAFSIGFTQNASFNNVVHYKGLNNYSSFAEQFAEEFSGLNISINDALNTKSIAPYTVAPALYTYLIDIDTINGRPIVKAAPEYVLESGKALLQEMTKTTKGGLYELAFSFAGNDGNKWLWGATLGIPIVNFQSNTLFSETDTSNDATNKFKSFTYNDNYTTKGAGINAKFGVIYRPKAYFRIGIAVHTPNYMSLTDERKSSLNTILEGPSSNITVNSKLFTDNIERGKAAYIQSMPWRAILSAAYVFREITDVTKQRGFVSADIEYVNHRGSRFSSNAEEPTDNDKTYYKSLNNVIKNIYKGNVNLRLGGEIKFNTIMARLGFGYYGNPYKNAPEKTSKTTLSTGIGYRNKGFFIDLTYVYLISKDFDVPYRLQNLQTVYAAVNQNRGNIAATIGFKF